MRSWLFSRTSHIKLMIKKIIEKIKSWFRPKEEMDPYEVMLHPEKSDTPVYENEQDVVGETAKQKKIRLKHKGK